MHSEDNIEMRPVAGETPAAEHAPGDIEANVEPAYPSGAILWLAVTTLCFGIFLTTLDNTILATAAPYISDEFHSLKDIGWYASIYPMAICMSQLLFGKLSARYSIRWVYSISMLLFLIGSAVCGAAPNSPALIVGRAIAGVGSSGLLVGAFSLVPKEGDWLPYWQALWRNSFDIERAVLNGYSQYKNQAAILPLVGLGGATFVLPPASETKFVTEQPDTVLNLREIINEGLKYRYTLSEQYILERPVHKKLIATTLTNQVGSLLAALADETIFGLEQHWGTDTEAFRRVGVWDTVGKLIGSATNRVFVGFPHCRSPDLLDNGLGYARSLPMTATLLSWVWSPLRPLVAPILTLPNRFFERRFAKALEVEIEDRLRRGPNTDNKKHDFLQWSIDQALESGDPLMWRPRTLAGRILHMNMVSIHTSSLTLTNTIFDLASSNPAYIEELRTEMETVLVKTDGHWTKAALAQMKKLDSVFRESARLNTLVAIGLRRVVVAKEGLTTPSGVHVPQGNFCAVPNLPVLTDSGQYIDPDTFKPWRFVDLRRDIESGDRLDDYVQGARLTFSATSSDFLAFGNGRQACPGRFFAATELKLMLAYMLIYYDIKKLDTRPPGTWTGILRIPATKAAINIRRRKAAEISPILLGARL